MNSENQAIYAGIMQTIHLCRELEIELRQIQIDDFEYEAMQTLPSEIECAFADWSANRLMLRCGLFFSKSVLFFSQSFCLDGCWQSYWPLANEACYVCRMCAQFEQFGFLPKRPNILIFKRVLMLNCFYCRMSNGSQIRCGAIRAWGIEQSTICLFCWWNERLVDFLRNGCNVGEWMIEICRERLRVIWSSDSSSSRRLSISNM